ncbi:MAG: hypothetical protein ACQEXQ_02545 [Bacillota bacterium]
MSKDWRERLSLSKAAIICAMRFVMHRNRTSRLPVPFQICSQVYRQDNIQEAFKVAIEAKGAIKVVVDLT